MAELKAEQARGADLDAEVQARLTRAQREQRAWAQGAEGERLVAAALGDLARYGWVTLHDLHWPGRPQANLDHVAIGPGGIFVVDAKNWSGDVVVSTSGLRQNGYDRTKQAESIAAAVADLASQLAPNHRAAVRGILCLAAQEVEPTTVTLGVVVVGRSQLPAMLAALPPRLSPYDVADLGRFLHAHLGGPKSPDVVHADRKTSRSTRTPTARRQRTVTVSVGGSRSSTARPNRQRSTSARAPRAKQLSCSGALLRFGIVAAALVIFLNLLTRLGG